MCGLWWMVQNQNTLLVFPQTTWPGHDSQDKAWNSHFPENQPHQHLMRVHNVSLHVEVSSKKNYEEPKEILPGRSALTELYKKNKFFQSPTLVAVATGCFWSTALSILQNAFRICPYYSFL